MNKNEENIYLDLIEKLTELKNLLKYKSTYDYNKIVETIEILSDENKRNDKKLIMNVKKYLSTDNFFNVRWAYDWAMPKINGKYWKEYIYEIQKLCEKV